MRSELVLVWLKRDLRLSDHQPLQAAIASGLPVLLLYCFEPDLLQHPDCSIRHSRFVYQSLQGIHAQLQVVGQHLTVLYGNMPHILEWLNEQYHIRCCYSHEETGHLLSYKRDKKVAAVCKKLGINWIEFATNGVIRRLSSRQNWNKKWLTTMQQPIVRVPLQQLQTVQLTALPDAFQLPTAFENELRQKQPLLQPGGEGVARQYLQSFLNERINGYRRNISKPEKARIHCSRLSPYLAYGNISIRQVFQDVMQLKTQMPAWRGEVAFFSSRLIWHCHFIQKLEMETSIETDNLNPAFNLIRNEVNDTWLQAWQTGTTGIPMIDACMRCLMATGYLNFRMRSMLASFATHHLLQPWQAIAPHLAQMFLDYEPGIHYPQLQMQAGTTGINTVRIYNPVKQGHDHDPQGAFIKKWLPELASVPVAFIHEPWRMTRLEVQLCGNDVDNRYLQPIVMPDEAAAKARDVIWTIKKQLSTKAYNKAILQKHTQRHSEKEQVMQIPLL